MVANNDFCFCGLALGQKYRDCAVSVGKDLEKYHPGVQYVILTDRVEDFQEFSNITAIQHSQDSIMFPYHDRRLVIKKALETYNMTIQIDTDIKFKKQLLLPSEVLQVKGITGSIKNLKQHLNKWQPDNLYHYQKVAEKLDLDFDNAPYLGEFIFAVSRFQDREKDWIEQWGKIGRYLELHKIHGADGPAMGLAIMKSGISYSATDWASLMETEYLNHLKFSSGKKRIQKSKLEKLRFKLNYHYRLNKARLIALQDFDFYYD